MNDEQIEQLRRLGSLRDEGILTADEFEAKKAALLSAAPTTTATATATPVPPPPASQPVMPTQAEQQDDALDRYAKRAVVLGAVGLVAWLLPIIGLPVGVAALVYGIKGLPSARRSMAIVGIVLASITLLGSVVNGAIGAYKGANGTLFASGDAGTSGEDAITTMNAAKHAALKMEECAAQNHDGSYAGCEDDAPDGADARVFADDYAYEVTVDGPGDIPAYSVENGNGSVKETCRPSHDRLCPGGRWPDYDDLKPGA